MNKGCSHHCCDNSCEENRVGVTWYKFSALIFTLWTWGLNISALRGDFPSYRDAPLDFNQERNTAWVEDMLHAHVKIWMLELIGRVIRLSTQVDEMSVQSEGVKFDFLEVWLFKWSVSLTSNCFDGGTVESPRMYNKCNDVISYLNCFNLMFSCYISEWLIVNNYLCIS